MENNQQNGMAICGLVLGIVSVVFSFLGIWAWIGLVTGIVGIITSVKGRKIENKKGLATAGMVLSIIGTSLSGILFLCALCVVGTASSVINELNSL